MISNMDKCGDDPLGGGVIFEYIERDDLWEFLPSCKSQKQESMTITFDDGLDAEYPRVRVLILARDILQVAIEKGVELLMRIRLLEWTVTD